jgi:hypothetical protein
VSASWPGGGNAYGGDLVIGDFKKNGVSGIVVMQGGNGETASQAVVCRAAATERRLSFAAHPSLSEAGPSIPSSPGERAR